MKSPRIWFPIKRGLWAFGFLVAAILTAAEIEITDIEGAPHHYYTRTPTDRFSRLQVGLVSGEVLLDRTSEKAFLESLLKALEIPASSQLLVFSTTSLQLSRISPSNPRALYFNDDTYVGYIPGGRIEIVSIDPELGGVFYIFDVPRNEQKLVFERSDRCLNCHARDDNGNVPGLQAKSVIPGPGGGSLTAYRIGQSGHGIPLDQRFGGWHVTGAAGFTNHFGNLTGAFSDGQLLLSPNLPGNHYSWSKYPTSSSDLLAHLLHEHQIGFVNRVLRAQYSARQSAAITNPPPNVVSSHQKALDEQADSIVRYLLFADEVPLPPGGVIGDETFKSNFVRNRLADPSGRSLKDLDLKSRLFRYRCSYQIYSPAFRGLSASMKSRVYHRLRQALRPGSGDPAFGYLPEPEKAAIREILQNTVPGFSKE